MKKVLKIVGLVLVALVVVVIIVLATSLNSIIHTGVEKAVPAVIQVPVTLEKVDISLLSGRGEIRELVIGNPEGFKTPHAIRIGMFKIDLDPKSVLTDTIVINEILIESPEITFEFGLRGSNLGKIQENAKQASAKKEPEGETKPEPKPESEPKKPAKKVIITKVAITGGMIKLSSPLMQGISAPIPLPPIELHDIGKDEGGASLADTIQKIIGAILGGATEGVKQSGKLIGKGAEKAGDAAVAGATAVADAGQAVVGGAASAAADGAEAVTDVAAKGLDATGDAAKAVGKGAADAVSGVFGGVKGLLGGDSGESESE